MLEFIQPSRISTKPIITKKNIEEENYAFLSLFFGRRFW
jgi:hypothetical protein